MPEQIRITEDELRAEVARITGISQKPFGFTRQDIQQVMGVGRSGAMAIIHALIAAGWVRGYEARQDVRGTRQKLPVIYPPSRPLNAKPKNPAHTGRPPNLGKARGASLRCALREVGRGR